MKLVLFDCDGTLVDSGDFIHRCMAASFADAGFAPPAVADTYSTIGLSLPLAIARLLGREPDDQVHWLTQRYKENFVTMRQAADFNEPLYEGILPLLAELGGRDDLLLGLVTGKSRRGVRSVLSAMVSGIISPWPEPPMIVRRSRIPPWCLNPARKWE